MKIEKMKEIMPPGSMAFVHQIDNVIFSHAGLVESFVRRNFENYGKLNIDQMIGLINQFGEEEMWEEDSPIWARPQFGEMQLYPSIFQVVGHTPVSEPLRENNLLSLDVFSTYYNEPLGCERFVIFDTESLDYILINDEKYYSEKANDL